MKLVCDREKFAQAFLLAASVVPSRSPKPILANVKLDAAKDSATMLGTDLEIGIRVEVAGLDVEVPGSVLLPINRFGAIVRESSDQKLTIESDGQKTRVRGQWSEFNLPSENPAEFPPIATYSETQCHELSARLFREVVRRTVFATDPESSRYALGGVLLEFEAEKITAVATDGRRLAKQEGAAKAIGGHGLGDRMTIVPTRAMHLFDRATADAEGNIQMTARDNDIIVKSDRVTIYSRLVEGRFPKWRDVFPRRDGAISVELPVGPFYAAVRQAAIVTSEDRRGVEFRFGEGKVALAGHGAEYGEAHIELPIAFDGEPLPVNLDPRFLGDFLRVLDPEKMCQVEIRDSESAVVFSTDDGYAYVIMPLAAGQA